MKRHHNLSLLLAPLLLLCACASTPGSAQQGHLESQTAEWPASVAPECPERKISVECFRKEGFPSAAVEAGMGLISEHLENCGAAPAEPVNVRVTIETKGGRPTCVDPSVWVASLEKHQSLKWLSEDRKAEAELARCAAAAIARHFVLPDSPEDEQCRWSSGLLF